MTEYAYVKSLNTTQFIRDMESQIGGSLTSISGVSTEQIIVDIDAGDKEDADEYLATVGFVPFTPVEETTRKLAFGTIQLEIGTGPFSQTITSSNEKANFWNDNVDATFGVISADSTNNELTIDSVFDTINGDFYECKVSGSVSVPSNDRLYLRMVHNDNGIENAIEEIYIRTSSGNQAWPFVLVGRPFNVHSATNQSVYLVARTVGGNEVVNWWSGSMTLRRV